ncbi:MAG: DUF2004 domain-containing protein [Thermoplasmatales archaeon]|nr:DUF2004 domain-containing protein [Candidatus Thermoplasmatota archaeon]MCL6003311.1 DUF2004 domain-containing protein [Candidatus Thermoplasmatota archaeon]MDA8055393.1 DUF2004 domain-containing protein [Thermoplasmatales archaeon]
MEKGLEITFKVSDIDERQITEALANIVGNEFLERIELDWRIFHVKLEDERFFKVCYTGPKMSRLHPLLEKEVRMRFETLSLSSKDEILKLYREEEKKKAFRRQYTREVEEERDLWQDNFWAYF